MSPRELARLLEPAPISAAEARRTFDRLVHPSTSEVERAGLLVALAARRRSATELAAFAREMRRRAHAFRVPPADRPVDLCGSGGAPRPSFNVSTVSAFVVASAGAPVVKHGNRSARGRCGSSDLLEALGLPVTTSRAFAHATYRRLRLAFLHAPLYHPATRAVAAVRRGLGVPTIFNRLGPLSNPARVPFQVVGVPDRPTAEEVAAALSALGVRRGLAMASDEGCDEFSPHGPTTAVIWDGPRRSAKRIDPRRHLTAEERRGSFDALAPEDAAQETERILAGASGARRGSVLLTSGSALWVSGRARSLGHGVETARASLDSGRAAALLERVRRIASGFRSPDAGGL